MAHYDVIGAGYAQVRQPDPRIAAAIRNALGDAKSVVNVGAGAGSYEPRDLDVVAVEPSRMMIEQRAPHAAPAIEAHAEQLPLSDASFDAGLAILTMHHWSDWRAGLHELRRVARRRIVLLTWDPVAASDFWLHDYLPEVAKVDAARFPPLQEVQALFDGCRTQTVPIPDDCTDGFMAAYWKRPHAYLDPRVRAGISSFSLGVEFESGLARLAQDLDRGVWAERWCALASRTQLDVGYRILVWDFGASTQA